MKNFQRVKDDSRFDLLRKLYDELKDQYALSGPEIIKALEKKDLVIPATIFREDISPLETVVKYLKENLSLNLKTISELTNRSHKTVWQAYDSAIKKVPDRLTPEDTEHVIPVSILSHRKLSILEAVVSVLREEHELGFSKIAGVLKRDERTIWTVYSRAKKKRARNAR